MSIDAHAEGVQMTHDALMSFHALAAPASADTPVLQRQMTPMHCLRKLPRTIVAANRQYTSMGDSDSSLEADGYGNM